MAQWVVLIVFYLWLGFTLGYFFRKWLEVSFLPRRPESGKPAVKEESPNAGTPSDD